MNETWKARPEAITSIRRNVLWVTENGNSDKYQADEDLNVLKVPISSF